jgi:hypothetical protein
VFKIVVVGKRLESKLVLEGNRKGYDKIHASNLCDQVVLAELAISFIRVDPNQARKILGSESQLGPVFASFAVSFVCGRATEAESETDDETEDCEEELVDTNYRLRIRSCP